MVKRMDGGGDGAPPASRGGEPTNRVATVPNLLCVIRLVGSIVLVFIAIEGRSDIVLWLFIFLAMTDWLDGKLAILLNQKSILGARLDSWADAALYAAILFAALWLHGPTIRGESGWVLAAVGTYVVSTLAGFWKYGRWPSYHTRAAKISWFLILVAVVFLFGEWSLAAVRVALAAVTLTNLEALAITSLSSRWRADVGSVVQVLRNRGKE